MDRCRDGPAFLPSLGCERTTSRPDKLAALKAQVGRQLAYLNRLCERMNRRGFAPFDNAFQAAINARNAVQDLHVAIHYAGVKHGVAADADDCKNSRRA